MKTKYTKKKVKSSSETVLIVKYGALSAPIKLLADIILKAELEHCFLISDTGELLVSPAIPTLRRQKVKSGAMNTDLD